MNYQDWNCNETLMQSPITGKYYLQFAGNYLIDLIKQAIRDIIIFGVTLPDLVISELQKQIYLIYDNTLLKAIEVQTLVEDEFRIAARFQKRLLNMTFTQAEKDKENLSDMRDDTNPWILSFRHYKTASHSQKYRKTFGVMSSMFFYSFFNLCKSMQHVTVLLKHLIQESIVPLIDLDNLNESLLKIILIQLNYTSFSSTSPHCTDIIPCMSQQFKVRFINGHRKGQQYRKKFCRYEPTFNHPFNRFLGKPQINYQQDLEQENEILTEQHKEEIASMMDEMIFGRIKGENGSVQQNQNKKLRDPEMYKLLGQFQSYYRGDDEDDDGRQFSDKIKQKHDAFLELMRASFGDKVIKLNKELQRYVKSRRQICGETQEELVRFHQRKALVNAQKKGETGINKIITFVQNLRDLKTKQLKDCRQQIQKITKQVKQTQGKQEQTQKKKQVKNMEPIQIQANKEQIFDKELTKRAYQEIMNPSKNRQNKVQPKLSEKIVDTPKEKVIDKNTTEKATVKPAMEKNVDKSLAQKTDKAQSDKVIDKSISKTSQNISVSQNGKTQSSQHKPTPLQSGSTKGEREFKKFNMAQMQAHQKMLAQASKRLQNKFIKKTGKEVHPKQLQEIQKRKQIFKLAKNRQSKRLQKDQGETVIKLTKQELHRIQQSSKSHQCHSTQEEIYSISKKFKLIQEINSRNHQVAKYYFESQNNRAELQIRNTIISADMDNKSQFDKQFFQRLTKYQIRQDSEDEQSQDYPPFIDSNMLGRSVLLNELEKMEAKQSSESQQTKKKKNRKNKKKKNKKSEANPQEQIKIENKQQQKKSPPQKQDLIRKKSQEKTEQEKNLAQFLQNWKVDQKDRQECMPPEAFIGKCRNKMNKWKSSLTT